MEKGKHHTEKTKKILSKKFKVIAKEKGFGKWMTGKHHSEETRKKITKILTGRPCSKETRDKIRKANLGRKHTEETKQKLREINLGRKQSKETIEKRRVFLIGNKHSLGYKHPKELNERISKTMTRLFKEGKLTIIHKFGEGSANWRGGITPLNARLRKSSMFKIWREAVFLRDNFTCQNLNCGYCNNKIGVMLHPHHIKPFALYPELRFDVSNGITYCKEFHINSKILHKNIIGVKNV